ncbi:hypothetical protein DB32_001209 [Sandaracinus amylolyticus]|uniref:Uncharacterized protein n=1 Tax=Sandaracinus amylolyticus TaxID=927083 RepID=A0A0F6YGK6_9BACT|nr:hypothetical protein DB32_001209 [Sandaracinus amylolyticus]
MPRSAVTIPGWTFDPRARAGEASSRSEAERLERRATRWASLESFRDVHRRHVEKDPAASCDLLGGA